MEDRCSRNHKRRPRNPVVVAADSTYVAYRDHMVGFFGLTLLSGALIALVGRKVWRGRPDLTLFIIGIIQAAFGLYIYINRFNLHG